jgi:DNA mismatch endonuclease, patch repair protein
MDTLTVAERSERMARIKSKNTKPELRVRQLVHKLGYRFRLHRAGLPGCPDLVFPSRRKVVFVHGCFWHAHEGCKVANMPKSRSNYWNSKFERNRARDAENQMALEKVGWRVFTIWECETRDNEKLASRLLRFLGPAKVSIGKRGKSNGRI